MIINTIYDNCVNPLNKYLFGGFFLFKKICFYHLILLYLFKSKKL